MPRLLGRGHPQNTRYGSVSISSISNCRLFVGRNHVIVTDKTEKVKNIEWIDMDCCQNVGFTVDAP